MCCPVTQCNQDGLYEAHLENGSEDVLRLALIFIIHMKTKKKSQKLTIICYVIGPKCVLLPLAV